MKIIKVLKNLWIDLVIQRTFLGGGVESIDGREVIYDSISTGYNHARLIFFKYYNVKENDVIVDVGCGKGRVFNYLLYKGLKNKMIGYEINAPLAGETRKNLRRFKNVEIKDENILSNFPANANLFYMFNPFKHAMMVDFKARILEIKDKKPVILYFNPTCIDVFDDKWFTYQLIEVPIPFFGVPYKLAIIRIA